MCENTRQEIPFHSTILCYRELTLYIILTKIFINFKSRKETFYIHITQCHWVMYEYQYDDIQQNIIKRCAVELYLPFLLSNFTHWLTVSVEWALIEFWSNLYDAAQARLLMHTRAGKKIQLLKPTMLSTNNVNGFNTRMCMCHYYYPWIALAAVTGADFMSSSD